MSEVRYRRVFLLLLLIGISAVFVAMIRGFLTVLLLGAVFAGVTYPVYRYLVRLLRGREVLAAILTLLLLIVAVGGPLVTVAGMIVNEAVSVSVTIGPRIEAIVREPMLVEGYLHNIPGYAQAEPYKAQILMKIGEMAQTVGTALVNGLSATTRGTVAVIFQMIVMLYAMFFFYVDGPDFLRTLAAYLPLTNDDRERMLGRFVSVARATLKGTLLIGAIQGTLNGLAFHLAGIDGAIFWAALMVVLSVVPAIGGALIWVPAVIMLLATGHVAAGVGLLIFCGLVVGSIDNVLRPRLVGRDTKMHDLMIFFSTMGGISLFGALGFIIGPIFGALFQTIWDIARTAFLPQVSADENSAPAAGVQPPGAESA